MDNTSMPVAWDKCVDVVVVGSGFAGLAAAIRAAELGASVIMLEKRAACGGNSIISDGDLVATGCQLQRQANIEDSPSLLLEDMLEAGCSTNQIDLAKIVAENAAVVCDWLSQDLGITFRKQVYQFAGHSIARSLVPMKSSGSSLIKPMLQRLKSLGIKPQTGWQMTELLLNDQHEINGVRIQPFLSRSKEIPSQYVKANKAVILATGGFSADIQFRMRLDSQLNEKIDCTNVPHATAEAIQEAMRIGAETVDLANFQLAPFTSPDEKGYGVSVLLAAYTVFPYGILIHPQTGRRFINELADRKKHVDTMLAIGAPCIGIADAQGVALSGQSIDKCLKRKVAYEFDQLAELAAHYQLPYEALLDSVKRYNRFIIQGHDDDLGKPILGESCPLSPPYYAVRLWPKVHYTMGGLQINSQAQVLNQKGAIIRGLYAAGEVTGGIHGASRLSTNSVTECLVFGRIAGENSTLEAASFLSDNNEGVIVPL